MHKQLDRTGFAKSELAVLQRELERERLRVERALPAGETSDEHIAILNALERIGDSSFGRCIACGGHITFGRLTVLPATEYCVGCSR